MSSSHTERWDGITGQIQKKAFSVLLFSGMLGVQITALMRSHDDLFLVGLSSWGVFLMIACFRTVTYFFVCNDLLPPEEKTA